MKIDDVISAGTLLSTAADALSQRCDNIIAAAEKAITVLLGGAIPLTPEQRAAVQAWKDATVNLGAHRDAVDAEVAKLDAALPQAAPTGDPTIPPVEEEEDTTTKKVAPVDK